MNAAEFAQAMPGVSPGIYALDDFNSMSDIAYQQAGIVLPHGKAMLVYSRLAPLVREAGCGTFANYIARIRQDADEQARAVAALTTNHTFFYREPHHFEHFADQVRPDMIARLRSGQPLRLWSAGCSSGEETWSLVMTLLGPDRRAGAALAGADLRVLATDLAPHALARATAATYPERELDPVPTALRDSWSTAQGGNRIIADTARDIVRFRRLNFLEQWPMQRRFDIIFCRNVMIYFDTSTKERLIARFADALNPGGYLYIGHSERVTGSAAAVLQPVGPTIYRKSIT